MKNIVRFDNYEVDLDSGQLYRDGIRIRLREQSFQVLKLLLLNSGELITRDVLRKQLWHDDVFVDFDNNLNIVVARLREALGDSAENPRFIETVPKHGYRFLCPPSNQIPSEDVELTDPAQHLKRGTQDLIAYREYVRGRAIVLRTPSTYREAKKHFELALSRDPKFANALDAIAELYWYLGYHGFWPPRKAFAAGIAFALRALEIDNHRGETHALLGQFHKTIEYNWPEVHREMMLALELSPTSPYVQLRYSASWLMPQGRLAEAIERLDSTLKLDPLFYPARAWLGIILVLARDYERAMEESSKLLQIHPGYYLAHFISSLCNRYLSNCHEAIAAQERAVRYSGGSAAMFGWLGLTFASMGRIEDARGVLQRLNDMAERTYVPPSSFAWVYLGVRELDTAFKWLNRAVEECDQFLMPIKSYGFLDPIREDPRFKMLLRKMNLHAYGAAKATSAAI